MLHSTIIAAMLAGLSAAGGSLRAPAVPLVVHNPYFSVWSCADRLTDRWPTHWTGAVNALCGLARIDGKAYRFCGPAPESVAAMPQLALEITATRTRYLFGASGVELEVEFVSPVLAGDPDLASRALSYINFSAASSDGAPHEVALYLDASAEWAVDSASQAVRWRRGAQAGIETLRIGAVGEQPLAKTGDNLRIDWGELVLGAHAVPSLTTGVGGHAQLRGAFAEHGELPHALDSRMPRAANDDWPVAAIGVVLPKVAATPTTQTWFIGYDEGRCVQLFGTPLAPYWARSGQTFDAMFSDAAERRAKVRASCVEFDRALNARAARVGGSKFAELAALAYRQTMGAHVIVADSRGRLAMFPKENTSNGCIGTIDVIFPSAPFFLALNPDLLEAQIRPVFEYAASERWKFPFAPHDLGVYPQANGQVYGGGEKSEENQMPVEESGNLIILVDALAKARADASFAKPWSRELARWAEYLRDRGLDPANQLCTDDFAGHLARNANLSIKAIVALGAYADLERRWGDADAAKTWRAIAENAVRTWRELALDGDHTLLAFGQPGTWSLKYNLVWDRVLELDLFSAELAESEVRWYRAHSERFGVPLDVREKYTKLDFAAWAASLASTREDFDALFTPLYQFADQTPDRVPLSDWFMTTDGRDRGMHARSVVGGIYLPLVLPHGFAAH